MSRGINFDFDRFPTLLALAKDPSYIKMVVGPQDFNMRMVVDRRKDKLLRRKPHWNPMASPGLCPCRQAPMVDGGAQMEAMFGDLPDMR